MSFFKNNNPEYHLENVVQSHATNPRTFLIPDKNQIAGLELGKLVKLVFVMETIQEDGCRAEKMWVMITEKNDSIFKGCLDSSPYYLKTIKKGDIISFNTENIAGIYDNTAPFNEKLFALITKKALDFQQINWVIRTDDINNDLDSGWQFYYGDESEEYLDIVDNCKIVSLENILSFEPLLEDILGLSGKYYEYSEEVNKFIEA